MPRLSTRVFPLACATALLAGGLVASGPLATASSYPSAKHVLLISVDGLHQSDLTWFIGTHPTSTLATLAKNGVEFSNASTPFPSDSFPGMTAQMTGGNPRTTGVYYDDTWNRALFPAAATSTPTCTGLAPGVEVTYFE